MRLGSVQVAMLGLTKKSPDRAAAHERLRAFTRERFTLDDDETIMVSEIACSVPGCPPVETHIVFWTQAGRHHFKIFKPLREVAADDLPPAFMKNALVAPEGFDCDCC
jgi:nitrate reductase molybdenum cofactor assembly chaperone NarJ/NarW